MGPDDQKPTQTPGEPTGTPPAPATGGQTPWTPPRTPPPAPAADQPKGDTQAPPVSSPEPAPAAPTGEGAPMPVGDEEEKKPEEGTPPAQPTGY
ncbi:hypothetical protein HY405_00765 [Candidatus Microgenomates bacterium]|nr:hypothetical protein [Candidatus Microgenomates bacterium]